MNKNIITSLVVALMCIGIANAQLNKSSCKFLGNITTGNRIQPGVSNLKYEEMWDQLTCENETKWGVIVKSKVSSGQEGVQKWDWSTADAHYKWCKDNGVMFKFHCLVWTSQFPSCLKGVTGEELKKQVGYWMDAVAIKYPDLAIIDVVNEAIKGHAEGEDGAMNFKNALSQALGNSNNPYDYKWITEAFKMARERFPNAVLIYNDYNTLTHQKTEFINLVSTLVKQGAPIDAYGHQTHDLDDYYSGDFGGSRNSMSGFANNLKDIHDQITSKGGRELQCYITEYDINQTNDNTQLTIMQGSFPAMWEAEFVSGITIWGYISGRTWRTGTGLISGQGQDRPSMQWLRKYMASDDAKRVTAKFCGKDAGGPAGPSVGITASKSTIPLGKSVDFSIELKNSESGIKSITIYDGNSKIGEGENFIWTPEKAGSHTINVVIITNGNEEVKGSTTITVLEPNKPYGGTAAVIPGKIEAEDYDEGVSGMAYYDKSDGNKCDDYTNEYRKDDVDLKKISGGVAVGSFEGDEWLSYTVDVQADGEYDVTLRLGEGNDSGSLSVEFDESNVKFDVSVKKLGDWGTFEDVKLSKKVMLKKGVQNMIIKNTGSWIDIDWIQFDGEFVGLNEATSSSVTIAPNPASSEIVIYGTTPTSVEIISTTGAVVKKGEGNVISVADLQDGNYIVRVVTENGVFVKKLVVAK